VDDLLEGELEDRDKGGAPVRSGRIKTYTQYPEGRGALGRRGLFAAALCLLLILPLGARAEVVDRVVAIINDSIITLSELNAATALAVDNLPGAEKIEGVKIIELKTDILDSLIEQKLVKQASDSAGIGVSEREVDNAVEEVRGQNKLSHEQLMLALAQSGLTYKEYREQLTEQIRQVKFLNMEFRSRISIQEEEIEDYYNQHIDEYLRPPTVRIRMIFLSNKDAKLKELRRREIDKGLTNGEEFASLARQYSEGPATESGGDMGRLAATELDAAFTEALKGLAPGQTSQWITKPDGMYLLKLIERNPGTPAPLKELRAEIYEELFNKTMEERFSAWLQERKKFAHIEIRL
jgi:peptidyl-prolyl cis-trans isomerase SurA